MAEFGIDTPQRQAAFLSQIRVESAGFKRTVENLNYSVPGLLNTFHANASAVSMLNAWGVKPVRSSFRPHGRRRLPTLVTAGRFGNVHAGDGWRYRGRGLKQITFYDTTCVVVMPYELDLITHLSCSSWMLMQPILPAGSGSTMAAMPTLTEPTLPDLPA
ncbi:hypothetical protein M8494_20655 [Serratia ureilytica]